MKPIDHKGQKFEESNAGRMIDMNEQDNAYLRDYFAAQAMKVILPALKEFPDEHWRKGVALDAYAMADAMLWAREHAT